MAQERGPDVGAELVRVDDVHAAMAQLGQARQRPYVEPMPALEEHHVDAGVAQPRQAGVRSGHVPGRARHAQGAAKPLRIGKHG